MAAVSKRPLSQSSMGSPTKMPSKMPTETPDPNEIRLTVDRRRPQVKPGQGPGMGPPPPAPGKGGRPTDPPGRGYGMPMERPDPGRVYLPTPQPGRMQPPMAPPPGRGVGGAYKMPPGFQQPGFSAGGPVTPKPDEIRLDVMRRGVAPAKSVQPRPRKATP